MSNIANGHNVIDQGIPSENCNQHALVIDATDTPEYSTHASGMPSLSNQNQEL